MADGLRRDAESPGFRPGLACASEFPTAFVSGDGA